LARCLPEGYRGQSRQGKQERFEPWHRRNLCFSRCIRG
jgi:hypothetical protein